MKDREEYISILEQENAELKKQLEKYKENYQEELDENCKLSELWCDSRAKIRELKEQQQYFINYLTAYIELLNDKPDLIEESQIDILKEILQKYKKIIGDKDE